MAYSVAANAILEIKMHYNMQGQRCMNVFHYRLTDPVTDGGAVALGMAQDFWNNVGIAIRSFQTTDVTLYYVTAQWVHPIRYTPVTFNPTEVAGELVPPTYSIGTCVVVRKQSDLAGKSHRGRCYLGGFARSLGNMGQIDAAVQDAVGVNVGVAMTLNVIDIGTAATAAPVIWSHGDPLDATPLLRYTVDDVLRYQRRREVGRGQ